MTSRRFDAVEFAVRGEQMIHRPADGRRADALTTVVHCDSDVEHRAPNTEVRQIEHSNQTDCFAASLDPERDDAVATNADLCRLVA